MVPNTRSKTDVRLPVAPERPPEKPSTPIARTPSSSAIEARLQRMPPAGRWALGLGLAFLSGLGFLSSMSGPVFLVAPGIPVMMMGALALAAGYTLRSWWATPALVAVACAGGAVAGWVVNQVYRPVNWISLDPGGLRTESQFFFALLAGLPIILFLLAGTALGRERGRALEQPPGVALASPAPANPPAAQPRSRLAASIQRAPLNGRWAVGLGLAFLSGLAVIFAPYANTPLNAPINASIQTALALITVCALALAAGYTLRSWWATPTLVIVASAGGLMASWGLTRAAPDGAGGEIGAIEWFATVALGPLIIFLLAGVGIGRQQVISPGRSSARTGAAATVRVWLAAIALMIGAGYLAGITGVAFTGGSTIFRVVFGILNAIVIAAPCLLTGWLLRSWWGAMAMPLVYAGVAALMVYRYGNGGVGLLPVLTAGFALYVVLPAVALSAIGAAIRMYRTRRSG